MSIQVGDLVSQLRNRSRAATYKLRDFKLHHEGDMAGILQVGDDRFPWGDRNTQVFTTFVNGPGYKYLGRQPMGFQAEVVKHHTTMNADTDVIVYVEGSNIAGMYHTDQKILPLGLVAERLANVFEPTDLADVLYATDQVEINVTSDLRTITVPGVAGVPDRPLEGTVEYAPRRMKVGDLSAGGVRVILQPGKPERAPMIQERWWRCFCDNQMTRLINGSTIALRGRTVDEILDEMEKVARQIFEGLEASGHAILHSAETPIPGATSDFIRQVGTERGLNARTILRLQEQGAALPVNPTVYDVTQIFTAMANEEGLPVATRRNLQMIGGDLTVNTDSEIHRCITCERPIAA